MEDRLSDDVDELHFTLLHQEGTDVYTAVMNKAWFSNVMSRFNEWDVQITNVIPDVLALPYGKEQHWLQLGNEWLIRKDFWLGSTVPESWLPFYLPMKSTYGESVEHADSVISHSFHEHVTDNDEHMTFDVRDAYSMLSQGVMSSSCTLLTGEFKPQNTKDNYWRVWKKCTYAMIFLLVLLSIQTCVETIQMNRQSTALNQESKRVFRTIFPNKKKIPTVGYLKRQLNNELAILSGGSRGSSILHSFEKLAQVLNNKNNIALQNFSYDAVHSKVKVDLKGHDFNDFTELRSVFETLFKVEQGPLNKSNGRVYGSFTLTKK